MSQSITAITRIRTRSKAVRDVFGPSISTELLRCREIPSHSHAWCLPRISSSRWFGTKDSPPSFPLRPGGASVHMHRGPKSSILHNNQVPQDAGRRCRPSWWLRVPACGCKATPVFELATSLSQACHRKIVEINGKWPSPSPLPERCKVGTDYPSPCLANLSRKVEGFIPSEAAAAVLLPFELRNASCNSCCSAWSMAA